MFPKEVRIQETVVMKKSKKTPLFLFLNFGSWLLEI